MVKRCWYVPSVQLTLRSILLLSEISLLSADFGPAVLCQPLYIGTEWHDTPSPRPVLNITKGWQIQLHPRWDLNTERKEVKQIRTFYPPYLLSPSWQNPVYDYIYIYTAVCVYVHMYMCTDAYTNTPHQHI